MILIHLSHVKGFAFERQARFLETRITQIGKIRRQTCRCPPCRYPVPISGPAKLMGQCLALLHKNDA